MSLHVFHVCVRVCVCVRDGKMKDEQSENVTSPEDGPS